MYFSICGGCLLSMHTSKSYEKQKKNSFSPEMKLIPSKAAMFYCCTCSYLQWVAYQELFEVHLLHDMEQFS